MVERPSLRGAKRRSNRARRMSPLDRFAALAMTAENELQARHSALLRGLAAREHVVVELLLLDAEPEVLLLEELAPGFVHLLEFGIARLLLGIELLRRAVAGVQDLARERLQERAVGDEAAQRRGIVGVVFRRHPHIRFG